MANFTLQMPIWTEDDFEEMQWHDCKIYAVAFFEEEFQLAFDIDYILQWIDPIDSESNFNFWVVPATLVFNNVYEININSSSVDLQIDIIYKDNPTKPKNSGLDEDGIEYDWVIDTTDGQIAFKAVGFKQFARGEPKLMERQSIGLIERGGICFDR